MQTLWLDFESYYDDEYSLRRMTPIEYINDPRFEALGCGFDWQDGRKEWIDGPDLQAYLKDIDWDHTFAVSHNALFDMLILARRYGVFPRLYGCTLSMARNWLSYVLRSVSLASVSEHYGIGKKMLTVLKTKGVNFHQLKRDPALYQEVRTYALDDAGKCRAIFERILEQGFEPSQLEIIDMVIRMAAQPKFELDAVVLAEHLADVQAKKQALLDAAFIDADNISSLMSDQQLATKLLFLGVNVPLKVSKTTGKLAYAFAKTDRGFTDLLEHDEPMVQALVAARLGVKSTLEETRTQRLMAIERVVEGMPVPLRYSGAHTHRFSGEWNINLQNLPRPNEDGSGGELRKAFKAPKGHVVVAVDASQIEARFNAAMAGEHHLVEAFREGRDVYSEFARDIYGYEVEKRYHRIERFVGKTAVLSLGYGSSWLVFQNMCRNKGGVILNDTDATRIVRLYRDRHRAIVAQWRKAEQIILQLSQQTRLGESDQARDLEQLMNPDRDWDSWGPTHIGNQTIWLPSGNQLRYYDLHKESEGEGKFSWVFKRGDRWQKIYGAKLVENVIQALAFIHIMEVAIRVKHMTQGLLMPQHQVHDELIYVVPENLGELVVQLVVKEMSTPPEWMPDAPLAAEGHIGETYYDAK